MWSSASRQGLPMAWVIIVPLLLGVSCLDAEAQTNTIGVYLDPEGTTVCDEHVGEYPTTYTVYLIARNTTFPLHGVSGRLDLWGDGDLHLESIAEGASNGRSFLDLEMEFEAAFPPGELAILGSFTLVARDSCSIIMSPSLPQAIPDHSGFVGFAGQSRTEARPLIPAARGVGSVALAIGEVRCPVLITTDVARHTEFVRIGDHQLCLYGHWQPEGLVEISANGNRVYMNGWRVSPMIQESRSRPRGRSAYNDAFLEARKLQRIHRMRGVSPEESDRLIVQFLESTAAFDSVARVREDLITVYTNGMEGNLPCAESSYSRGRPPGFPRVPPRPSTIRTPGDTYKAVLERGDVLIITSGTVNTIPADVARTEAFADAIARCSADRPPITMDNWGSGRLFNWQVARQLREPLPLELKGGMPD